MSWSDYDGAVPAEGMITLTYPLERPDAAPEGVEVDYYARFEGEIYNLCVNEGGYPQPSIYLVHRTDLYRRDSGPPEAGHHSVSGDDYERILRGAFAAWLMEESL